MGHIITINGELRTIVSDQDVYNIIKEKCGDEVYNFIIDRKNNYELEIESLKD